MKLRMAAELPAILAHSILGIVGGISYEEGNIGITGSSRPILVECTHPSP